jgi:soluble lytic murein transglycosylase-like protein
VLRYISLVIASCLVVAAYTAQADDKKQLKLSPGDVRSGGKTAVPAAQKAQIAVYKSVNHDGTALFSDRQPLNRPFQMVRYDCFACDPVSTVNWHTTPLYIRPYQQQIAEAATEHQLDPALIRAVIHAESSFRPGIISRKGAIGLMQLMPQTAADLGVIDASAPAQNIAAGSRYLAGLIKQHNGEVALALAAYNAGASNVKRYNGIPPFAETQAYVERVAILRKRYQQAG